ISFAWRTYFNLFDFTDVIAICFSNHQADDANHDYPLDTPNFYYDQDQTAILFGLMGTGDTHASLSGSYDEDFFVGYSDYYSRYDWHRDINVYKNDMHINLIDHPHEGDEHLAAFGDLDLMRCDFAGRPLALVATLECLAPGEYRVHYNDSSQTAINNGVIDEKLVENGQVLGLPVVNDQVFDLTTSTGDSSVPHISFSDCFYSEEMLTRSSIENMNTDYTYRLYSHNNGTEIRAILSHIPVYTIQLNEIWRANLTKDEVDADTEGTLALENDLHIKFLSNHDMHVLRYHLLEGHGNDEEHEIDEIDTGNEGRDPYEHYDQHENDGLIGWDGLWFVPEIQSDHNNNTYGCYKETINRAYVYLDRDHSRPSSKLVMSMLQVTGADGKPYRYFHTGLSLWSRQEIYQNANSEERYLYRIWREVKSDGNGSQAPRRTGSSGSNRVLLNEAPELEVNNDLYSYWTTDYAGLQEFTGESLVVSDTFLAEVPADPAELENFALNVEYQAVLYIHDTVEDLFYPVSSMVVPVTWDLSDHSSVVTGLMSIDADNRTVADVEYYNVTGQRMTAPSGITIVVTRFTDGTSMTTKQIFK
ncbi:MAG: hypothetical protein J6X81_04245, partial [Muribaculaceae bacterium]|nr:hypothetical protein [Muribaculaceae bacterium]